MLISTRSHGEKIYHNPSCTYAQRTKPENRILFCTANEAAKKGYRACSCCSFMGQHYRKEEAEVRRFANRNGMKIWLHDDAVYIENMFAAWKITRFSKTDHMCLLHANRENLHLLKTENGKIIHNYHLQKDARYDSILGYLQYIKQHDEWRSNQLSGYKKMPKKTAKQRKLYRHERKISKRRAVGNVLSIIDRLQAEREYREMCYNR